MWCGVRAIRCGVVWSCHRASRGILAWRTRSEAGVAHRHEEGGRAERGGGVRERNYANGSREPPLRSGGSGPRYLASPHPVYTQGGAMAGCISAARTGIGAPRKRMMRCGGREAGDGLGQRAIATHLGQGLEGKALGGPRRALFGDLLGRVRSVPAPRRPVAFPRL